MSHSDYMNKTANYLEKENLQNKSRRKISEFTVFTV